MKTRALIAAIAVAGSAAAGAGCEEGDRSSASTAPSTGPELVRAEAEGPVAQIVRRQRAKATQEGDRLLVYVSADWCAPCRVFQRAVRAGELDETLPDLRLLVFDLDRDEARLATAGYDSQMIPLFVVPGEDGRGTDRRIQGSVKGDAVGDLVPRLRELLNPPR